MTIFNNILVVVDSSQPDPPELQRALKLAEPNTTQLHLVDIVKDSHFTLRLLTRDYAHIHELLVKEKQEQLQTLVGQCLAQGINTHGEVLEGTSSQETLAAAQRCRADLIVRATKGTNSRQAGNLGTSSQKLLRDLPCSLWLAAAQHEPICKSIVAAVDATPGDEPHRLLNMRILQMAKQLAECEQAQLSVVYVWSLYGSEMLQHRLPANEYETLLAYNRQQHRESFDRLLSECCQQALAPVAQMLEGEPSQAIPQHCQAQSADLLICGSVARHGIPGLLLGNTAERIVNRVNCSILAVVPPKD
jgi:universal stress protein E